MEARSRQLELQHGNSVGRTVFLLKGQTRRDVTPSSSLLKQNAPGRPASAIDVLISRAPSVSCATRLMLSVCLFLFFLSPGISSESLNHLNKSLHGDGKWLGIEHSGFHFWNF